MDYRQETPAQEQKTRKAWLDILQPSHFERMFTQADGGVDLKVRRDPSNQSVKIEVRQDLD